MNNLTKIFGAPGCGKTHYLLNLLDDLLKVYQPQDIAYVSFTRKGAYEGRDRAIEKFGYSQNDFPFFRTLHSIAFSNAGLSRADVINKGHYKKFSKALDMNFTGYYTEDFTNNDDKYLFAYFMKTNNPKAFEAMQDSIDMNKLRFVFKNYEKFKKQFALVDYNDMIIKFVKENRALPVKVAIIDEAQDLTTLQWDMCQIAFRDCEKVYIAGDDDQAIYEWSGADVNYFLDLPGEQVILDHSYRMPSNILNFSKQISSMIEKRVDKVFSPKEEGGMIYFHNSLDTVELKKDESYYFLSRNNFFLNKYEKLLKARGLFFYRKGKQSIEQKIIRAIIAYERYRKTGIYENDVDALIVDTLKRTDVDGQPPWFEYFNLDIDELTYCRDLIRNKESLTSDRLQINTIHGVKGGEADNVVLLLDITKNVRNAYRTNADSELRCLYVGCTRAKKNLHIVNSASKNGYDDILNFNTIGGEND